MSAHDDATPDFQAPRLGCDINFHVLGEAARYSYGYDLRYAIAIGRAESWHKIQRGFSSRNN